MAYWLVKSEPETWSWDMQVARGTTHWDGVRNHQASNNLKAMRRGDQAFFYHSGEARAVVGIVELVREYYPDPSDPAERFGMVDFKAVRPLARPVTLAEVKADPALQGMALVRNARLSVQPVTEPEWTRILRLGETAPP